MADELTHGHVLGAAHQLGSDRSDPPRRNAGDDGGRPSRIKFDGHVGQEIRGQLAGHGHSSRGFKAPGQLGGEKRAEGALADGGRDGGGNQFRGRGHLVYRGAIGVPENIGDLTAQSAQIG